MVGPEAGEPEVAADALAAGEVTSVELTDGTPVVVTIERIGTNLVERFRETADAVLVIEDGKPVGVLTRADLLGHLVD